MAGQYRYTISRRPNHYPVDSDGDGVADQTLTIANGAFALGETAPGSNILHIVVASGTSGADTLTGTLGDDSIYAQAATTSSTAARAPIMSMAARAAMIACS